MQTAIELFDKSKGGIKRSANCRVSIYDFTNFKPFGVRHNVFYGKIETMVINIA